MVMTSGRAGSYRIMYIDRILYEEYDFVRAH